MTVQQQTFTQPVASNIPVPTTITNVIATLTGTASPERFYVITGHLDSRVTDVLDFTSDAPGADDDASGVAVVLELARLFATRQFPGTLVFATVAGEEQGLYGSTFMAAQMAAAGDDEAALPGSSARSRVTRNAWSKVPLRRGKVNLLFLNSIASFGGPAYCELQSPGYQPRTAASPFRQPGCHITLKAGATDYREVIRKALAGCDGSPPRWLSGAREYSAGDGSGDS